MGMYDYVDYAADCSVCASPLSNFQSKDADCRLNVVSPAKVHRFYAHCKACGAWNEFRVVVSGYTVERSEKPSDA
jgi:hypothetical protein